MGGFFRSTVAAAGTAVVMVLGTIACAEGQEAAGPASSGAALSGSAPSDGKATRDDYELCLAGDETAFRSAIEAVAIKALETSVRGVDYRLIVSEEWRKGGIDDVIARRVDSALDELKQETSWSELLASLAYKETQEKLARSAAERVYGSKDVKAALETLADGVGRSLSRQLDPGLNAAADGATRCLTTYLRHRYGNTLAQVIARDARNRVEIDAAKGRAEVSGSRVLIEGKEGIAGLVVVIMRRQLGSLASRIGQRFVGAVLGRVVSAVAGGIGVVLIAKDLWELRNGVLPIIATEMKSTATRDRVQVELAASIETEIAANVREIARGAAEKVYETLVEHRRAHAKVLELAERKPEFKRFTDAVSPANLGRLDEIVALQLSGAGEAALLGRVADGSLGEAVEHWPTAAMEIARDQRSLDAGFQWRALAGDTVLPKVVEFGIHRRADPGNLTKPAFTRILSLDDRVAIARLVGLKSQTLEPLFELADPSLKKLARALGDAELASLASYLTALEKPAAHRLLSAIADAPGLMQAVASDNVRNAVLGSRDQAAALGILLRREDIFDVAVFWRDAGAVRSGAVSPRVLIARYPLALVVLGFFGIGCLVLVWRAVLGRRPRVAVVRDGRSQG